MKKKALYWQADKGRESKSKECNKIGNPLYVSQHQHQFSVDYKKQWFESTVYKNKELMKHGGNLPSYLQTDGKNKNSQNKTFSFGVLDWNHLENWKSKTKRIMKSSLSGKKRAPESGSAGHSTYINNNISQQTSKDGESIGDSHEIWHSESEDSDDDSLKGTSLDENKAAVEHLITDENNVNRRLSSFSRRFSFNLEKISTTFSFKTNKSLKSGSETFGSLPDLHNYKSKKDNSTDILRSISMSRFLDPLLKHKNQQSDEEKISLYEKQQKSCNLQTHLHLTMKNGIPFFKIMVDNSSNILTASVKKLPSGKDDSSLIYTFHSVREVKNKKDSGFGYKVVGQMKISSSYHAEFNGLEKDLFVVRESVLYSSDPADSDLLITSDCSLNGEVASIIVKNKSNENYGGIGSSKSTVVILPGGNHSLPNSGKISSLIDRWKSGGACDCGGWDIGCELRLLTNETESIKNHDSSTLDRLDLCYQGMHKNKHALRLGLVENGVYSLEYNPSVISLLQAFSVCVAVVSSQDLTHIFQVNHLQDDFSKPVNCENVKTITSVNAKIPPTSPIGRV